MELLPKASIEFKTEQYWNNFFSIRGLRTFEWYGEYTELCHILNRYLRCTDKILISGCGNSELGGTLYKIGFRDITNVDISTLVISQMKEKYKDDCPEMKFLEGDMLNLKFDDGTFSSVLDKGTLDALMSDNNSDSAFQYFTEINRVMKVGGRYICITLLQEHVLTSIVNCFSENGWIIIFCKREESETKQSGRCFSFPIFAVVCTKFKNTPNFRQILEIDIPEGSLRRASKSEVKEFIASLQQYAFLTHRLKSKSLSEEVKLELCHPKTGQLRFTLFVLDCPKPGCRLEFSVFIVPQGREHEWLFGTSEGRLQLAESADTKRLAVVHLMRGHSYGRMEDVQDELSPKVLELTPSFRKRDNFKVQRGASNKGNDLGDREEKHRGRSSFSGEFLVEDVKCESQFLRRLIFLSNQNVIQSEAKLIPGLKKKGSGNSNLTIDPSYLACCHHSLMIGAIQLVSYSSSVLLIGLGSGGLANYMHRYFPQVVVTAVEIDPVMLEVAKSWFAFTCTDKLCCFIEDGVEFIRRSAKEGSKYEIVMFDVDSKDTSLGLSCPPRNFLEKSFLDNVASCISENGLFVLNLVCRNLSLKKELIEEVKCVFPVVLCMSIPEEVNEILFCGRVSSYADQGLFHKAYLNLNKYLKRKLKTSKNVLNVDEIIANVAIIQS